MLGWPSQDLSSKPPSHHAFCPFSSQSFTVLALKFRSWIRFEFRVRGVGRCPVFPAPSVGGTWPFPVENLSTSVANHSNTSAFTSRFSALSPCSLRPIFSPIAHCFEDRHFIISFEILSLRPPTFCFKIILFTQLSLRLLMNFRMDFSISAKDVIGILTEMGIDSVITLGSTDTSIVSKSTTSSSLLKTVCACFLFWMNWTLGLLHFNF